MIFVGTLLDEKLGEKGSFVGLLSLSNLTTNTG